MPSTNYEYKVIDEIIEIEEEEHEVKVKGYYSAFMVHFIFKVIPLGILGFIDVFNLFFDERYNTELIILFVIIEFWFTKNITGKRMMGARWFFGEDEYGVERLMFECRANPEFIDFIKPKLFWVVQLAYCIIPVIFIIQAIFLNLLTSGVDFTRVKYVEFKIGLNLIALVSGVANNFFFMKISDGKLLENVVMAERQSVLKTRLGSDGLRKIGLGSITSNF